jgi:hypothetical protein
LESSSGKESNLVANESAQLARRIHSQKKKKNLDETGVVGEGAYVHSILIENDCTAIVANKAL